MNLISIQVNEIEFVQYNHFFHHTTCESTCDTLPSSAANQVAQGGTAAPSATKQLLPPDRVFKRNIYQYIRQIYTPDQLKADITLDVRSSSF